MRILGIDPGLERTGFAVLENNETGETLLDYGRIRTPAGSPLHERLRMLEDDLLGLIKQWSPGYCAIEEIYFSKNVKTALTVSHARGVILKVAASAGLSVHAFNPATIKSTITGDGRADKLQIQKMLAQILGIQIASDDAADAIACALCCVSHVMSGSRLSGIH